jgi:peptide/nickel transport system ATP-binding protein
LARYMDRPVLDIQHLQVGFAADGETVTAVHDSSFTVRQGEVVAVVGESGSGKSITSLAIMQLLPKQAKVKGQILFCKNGKDPIDLLQCGTSAMNRIRGKDIAMIFQEPMTSLNPVFTCGQQVMEALLLHQAIDRDTARQQTLSLFEQVQLPHPEQMLHRYPHQLSGGQKQRVMIAMAMSCGPALLIADEPTTALDVTVQKTILQLIKQLQQRHSMGVIFITHDLGVVADIADKLVVMYKGSIVEQGAAAEVLRNPRHRYTQALLACRPAIHPKGQRLPVVSDFLEPGPVVPPTVQAVQQPVATDAVAPIALSIENLTVRYAAKKQWFGKTQPAFTAVNDVSFAVRKGEVVGLVGESGCGKTTLGRCILQLIRPSAGRILLNGHNIANIKGGDLRRLRKDLQIVFQDPYGSLNPRITIGSAILEPLTVHGLLPTAKQRRDKVVELLEKVNLKADHFNRYPHQFSGGQRQRICIARALAPDPAFLIFDESVSALDVSVQAQVLNLINDLKQAFGFTAIFISHDLSVVRYISNRIVVMQKGRIVEQGDADAIYQTPQHDYTRQLIEAIPGKTLVG